MHINNGCRSLRSVNLPTDIFLKKRSTPHLIAWRTGFLYLYNIPPIKPSIYHGVSMLQVNAKSGVNWLPLEQESDTSVEVLIRKIRYIRPRAPLKICLRPQSKSHWYRLSWHNVFYSEAVVVRKGLLWNSDYSALSLETYIFSIYQSDRDCRYMKCYLACIVRVLFGFDLPAGLYYITAHLSNAGKSINTLKYERNSLASLQKGWRKFLLATKAPIII